LPSLSGAKVYKTKDCEQRASSLVQNSRSIACRAIQRKLEENHVQAIGKLLYDKFKIVETSTFIRSQIDGKL